MQLRADDHDEIIVPAVSGTIAVLCAAQRSGTVRRVVITGSVTALIESDSKPRVFNEDGWNNLAAFKEVETRGCDASSYDKYSATKTLQERAVWEFMVINEA